MDEYLIKKIEKMEGSTVGIGINSQKIKNAIETNPKINIYHSLEASPKGINKKKFKMPSKLKKVNIKKIKKVFKKKRINNIICNYDTIKDFLKTFVRDSVYINKEKLYIYGKKTDLEPVINKYKRYTDKIELIEKKDQFLLIIDNTNTKNKKLEDIGYWWLDTINSLIDFLTIILAN